MKQFRISLAFVAALALVAPLAVVAPSVARAETKKHQPKYPIADARAKALALVPGTIVAEELEYEAKRWIYSIEIKPKGEKGKLIKEVNIDADSGDLISVETEKD